MKRNAVLVDMDGTLVDVSSLRYHVIKGLQAPDGSITQNKNFKAFHEGSVDCPPIPSTLALLEAFSQCMDLEVVIVTARSERFKPHTSWWLAEHNISHQELYMRPDFDYREDVEVKKDLLERIRQRFNPVHAIDDNPAIVQLWLDEGIPTTIIPGWLDLE